ncbi:dehydrogenase [Paenibacillus contaminans]|jgi:toxin CptA|uniref:Dehydrogenase n=1 Tax=Paenibacillus contaminans TaxID=450362 RepID=A0A329MHC1_9BACL|nr:dehydrogenase [Paenibacillus contaminans]RAV16757.1 dehydrogenase [Paenibacillus contaminans]
MHNQRNEKHAPALPTARGIRRACNKELYRTIKKLKIWIPPEQLEKAEQLYAKKVLLNLLWIHENGSNRKALADWWDENVCPEISELWNVERDTLGKAFRESFGG